MADILALFPMGVKTMKGLKMMAEHLGGLDLPYALSGKTLASCRTTWKSLLQIYFTYNVIRFVTLAFLLWFSILSLFREWRLSPSWLHVFSKRNRLIINSSQVGLLIQETNLVSLKSDSHVPKKFISFAFLKTLKNEEKCLFFHLKSSFHSQDI